MVTNEAIILAMTNRQGRSFSAPEPVQPAGKFSGSAEALEAFLARRSGTLEYLRSTRDPLRHHFRRNGALGLLDAYQWLVILSAHTERHRLQVEEIMGSPDFPSA